MSKRKAVRKLTPLEKRAGRTTDYLYMTPEEKNQSIIFERD